jgi:hypothetical protein
MGKKRKIRKMIENCDWSRFVGFFNDNKFISRIIFFRDFVD